MTRLLEVACCDPAVYPRLLNDISILPAHHCIDKDPTEIAFAPTLGTNPEDTRTGKFRWRNSTAFLIFVFLVNAVLTGCDATDPPLTLPADAEWLVDITSQVRLDFEHTSGIKGDYFLQEIMGAAAAVFDYDGDGNLDIYLINVGQNRLYRQTSEGTFIDVTKRSGLGDDGYGMGTAVGDIDNDGDLNLLVTNYDDDRLYLNRGDGTFEDITGPTGIAGPRWSTSAAFCDIDADNYLDLCVTRYVTNDPAFACSSGSGEPDYCGPNAYRGLADQLYRNNGDGTFTDISQASGIAASASNGLGVICFDFNDDNRSDFLVANDGERNQLWINQGYSRFLDRAVSFGIAVNIFGDTEASMGVALEDVNGDQQLDVFVTHLDQESNTLYLGTGPNALMDATATSGLGFTSTPYTGFGTELFDADQDGDLDLVIANGKVRRGQLSNIANDNAFSLSYFHEIYAETNQLMINNGTGRFEDACGNAMQFCNAREVSRGLLTADIDNDGDLDVLVTNANGPAQLFRNDIPRQGNWLMLRAMDPTLNRDAIGALLRVHTARGALSRPVMHTRSYLSSADAGVHVGIGDASRVSVDVVWPDGKREHFAIDTVYRTHFLVKGDGEPDA
ncbi:MAG: CRTAC1 family protein [Pseudomonadota bacterium]